MDILASEYVESLIGELTLQEKVSLLMYQSPAIERLGIPEYNWWNEGLHGVARAGRATVFPQAIMLAATFNKDLAFDVATAISDEARAKYNAARKNGYRWRHAGLTFWTPNINIFRDPRWGRGQETYGECPTLTSVMASQLVRGFQGNDSRYMKIAACAKHYAVHSGPEALRHSFNARVSEKDLRETYLPAFKALVEAGVEAVMCAYNRVNDLPCCGHSRLIGDILRGEWKFSGHVLSDGFALPDLHQGHGITEDEYQSAVYAFKNGINLDIGTVFKQLVEAVNKGDIRLDEIDNALRYTLATREKLGLIPHDASTPWDSIGDSVIDSPQHRQLALDVARQGIVLLQNMQGALPLAKNLKTLYITGPNATSVDVLLGNYYGLNPRLVTILEGIISKVDAATMVDYKPGFQLNQPNINPIDWMSFDAVTCEAIIAVLGLNNGLEGEEGEAIMSSTMGDRENIDFPESQMMYIRKLRSRYAGKIVAVVCAGSPLDLTELCRLVDAVVWTWYPGQEGGTAVAEVIFGDVCPSGKLPVTFPASTSQLPAFDNYDMAGRTYRYMTEIPAFRFGFGLSYSKIEYGDINLSISEITGDDVCAITSTISNVGDFDASEVIQLYVSSPYAGNGQPIASLVDFKRVFLRVGESIELVFSLSPRSFVSFSNDGCELLLPGRYIIHLGNCSPGTQVFHTEALVQKTTTIFVS